MRTRLIPRVNAFFAPSRFLRSRFVEEWGLAADRIEHVPLGVEVDALRAAIRTSSDRVRVAFIGSLIPVKGPELLLRAWEKLTSETRARATLTLFGPSQHDPAFQRRLSEFAASVGATLGGRIARDEMPARLASIDLLVVPSLWYENSPLVILEARAARTPLLVAALGGMAELVEPGRSGEHFRAGDADDLARKIAELVDDRARLDRLIQTSVPPPSVDAHVDALEERYRALTGTRPR
jgi:glycosyltransferase involved in cell wall biosynthesis